MIDPATLIARMQPRMTLRTLNRGDGLLGMRASGPFGPRAAQVTLVQIEWLYGDGPQPRWIIPAPTSILNRRPASARFLEDETGRRMLLRDFDAEAEAQDAVWELGLHPLRLETLQWRGAPVADLIGPYWSLVQEAHFGDFWALTVPTLQAKGWSVVVQPGFAHESVPVQRWRMLVAPESGEVVGKEVASTLVAPPAQFGRAADFQSRWLLSLGVEIDGELRDVVPLLAQLLKRDARWLNLKQVQAIDDEEMVRLRLPGGQYVHTPAAPIKPIVLALLDLITDPARIEDKPLFLSAWDALRFDVMCAQLAATQRDRAGEHGRWALQGEAGLREIAQRLGAIGSPAPVAQPDGMGISLRSYQREGVAWLQTLRAQHLGGILADDMGLGKTAQVLAHLLLEKQAGRLDVPALIVVPTTLIFNWQAEVARMTPSLRLLCWHGAQREEKQTRLDQCDLVLTTYGVLWRDMAMFSQQTFHTLVLDEAQQVKNATTRGADAIRRVPARHRLSITGTPLENNLGELWAQFDFLMPGFLGDARSFARQWRKPIEIAGDKARAQLLAQRVRPFILRRRKDAVANELPARTEIVQHVQLRGRQRDLYESVRLAADDTIRLLLYRRGLAASRVTILAALLKLRQVCCDPYLLKDVSHPSDMGRAKLEWLRDTLPTMLAEGRRVLVFSQFTEMLNLIAQMLEECNLPHLMLTGQTPASARADVVKRFQDKTHPLMLVSLKAGGVGLNLTAADTVILFDPWWNPAVEEQASARAHRIGQIQPVFVYRLVVEGSIEERMLALQQNKHALAQQVVGKDVEGSEKFGVEELHQLLAPLNIKSDMRNL